MLGGCDLMLAPDEVQGTMARKYNRVLIIAS